MEVVFVGAEKLPTALADAFEQKFGVRPYEGYGATELSPMAAGNMPASRGPGAAKQGARPGTVGRPLPGVEAKVVDLETGADLGLDKPGMLLIRGPNVMKGYLEQPEATAQVIRDGWYVTGDVAIIDADGFIRITDRLSRFSKIGGEMVPHLRVEEAILTVLAGAEVVPPLAVIGVPDTRKGERLVVIHTGLSKPGGQIIKELAQAGLPPLWIPSADSFVQVEALPAAGHRQARFAEAETDCDRKQCGRCAATTARMIMTSHVAMGDITSEVLWWKFKCSSPIGCRTRTTSAVSPLLPNDLPTCSVPTW